MFERFTRLRGLVFLRGGVPPHRPNLAEWMRGGPSVFRSPPLPAKVRNR